jgi:hypothetical protein
MLERLYYSVREICEMTGFCRVKILGDIASGKLKARRRGRMWFAMRKDLTAYLHGHPSAPENPPRPDGDQ